MRAHLVQLDIAWEDQPANFGKVSDLLARTGVNRGDLVILPEMFDTGFSFAIERTADSGRTLEFLSGLATRLGAFVQGGRTVRNAAMGRATNRAPVFGPDGRLLVEYAKIHPFSFGREPERFDGGKEVITYPWGSAVSPPHLPASPPPHLTVCPAICYDLRFPELFRLGLLKGAEVYALGANWPDARQAHWRALLIARAIENQAFVLAVNRTGRDPHLNYVGGSIALGPRGEVLGELTAEEAVLSVEVDAREVHAWREKFPAWKDLRLVNADRADSSAP